MDRLSPRRRPARRDVAQRLAGSLIVAGLVLGVASLVGPLPAFAAPAPTPTPALITAPTPTTGAGPLRGHFPPRPFPPRRPFTFPPFPTPPIVPKPTPTPIPTRPPASPKPAPLGTAVSLLIPTDSQVGQDVVLSAYLRSQSGRPLGGQHLQLFLDGSQLSSGVTDAAGDATFTIQGHRFNQARQYQVEVQYPGTHGFTPSQRAATLRILAAAIQISTVPPVAGVSFTLAGTTAMTGPDGVADLPVPATGSYPITTDLNPDERGSVPVRVSFVRWADGDTNANRTLFVHGPAAYTVGLRAAYLASVTFVDPSGAPIDAGDVTQATFTSSDGMTISLDSATGTQFWSTASVAQATNDGPYGTPSLVAQPVVYQAVSVEVRGAEALAPGQADWTPSIGSNWDVGLDLYDLRVRTQDAFFGSPTPASLSLRWADGSTSKALAGADGVAVFKGLPAGKYNLDVSSAAMAADVAIAVNGAQEATLRVVTHSDALVAGSFVLLAFGLALLFLGRSRARRRRSPAG